METIRWIQRYHELGFVTHPCCPNDHYCKAPGKVPYDPLEQQHMKGWQEHGQFGLEQWREWLDYDSNINLGFLCGSPSRLLCVDIDNEGGQQLFQSRCDAAELRTWQYATGHGKRYLYRHDNPSRSFRLRNETASFEVLGDGKQSVLPPSTHPSGRSYSWVAEYMPRTCEIQPAPAFLLSDCEEINSEPEDWTGAVEAVTPDGTRNETLTRLAGHLLSPGAVPPDEVLLWLRLYNEAKCNPSLDDKELQTIAKSINGREQQPDKKVEREVREIMFTRGLNYSDAREYWRARQ